MRPKLRTGLQSNFMSDLFDEPTAAPAQSRYSDVDAIKASGATYTPPELAAFVADKLITAAEFATEGVIRVLDPAAGDGALLDALVSRLPSQLHGRLEVHGFDTDEEAIKSAEIRLNARFPALDLRLQHQDFLSHVLKSHGEPDLLTQSSPAEKFDLVIANPPYVRTQVLGAKQAQELSESFGLTGRVDLYYPFFLAISKVLKESGTTAVITSNRFMTTKSGQSIRRALLSNFDTKHVWDLGDTKLFEAAVLPAVFLARGTPHTRTSNATEALFTSIYASNEVSTADAVNQLAALSLENSTVVQIPDGRKFQVRHGILDNGGDWEGVWRISTEASDAWMDTVVANTWDNFRRIGKIRVGVKSTADKVFVRNDWDTLPGGRPELLRPLITRHCAQRFRAMTPANPKKVKEILYPHEATSTGRRAVDIAEYPISEKYLEAHRSTLEARTYVIKAGRKWYELWVPQDPSAWPMPKLVFPDISDEPIFWIDTDGGVVNGECYWLQCQNPAEQNLLWLALAVANSSFIVEFYDHRFNNKLYANRRRFMSQYVEEFPLPDPKKATSLQIIETVKMIHAQTPSNEAKILSEKLNLMVWDAFGLSGKEVAR